MAQSQYLRRYAFAILGSLLLAGAAASQDPLVVNAGLIRLKLENDRVRVFEATLAPGEKENPHSHPATVIYVIAGGKIRTHHQDGTTSEATLETGATLFREPLTHWTENIGDTTIKVMLVEMKTPEAAKEAKSAN